MKIKNKYPLTYKKLKKYFGFFHAWYILKFQNHSLFSFFDDNKIFCEFLILYKPNKVIMTGRISDFNSNQQFILNEKESNRELLEQKCITKSFQLLESILNKAVKLEI